MYKINAIKLMRERTSMALKDAKALVEEIEPMLQNSDTVNDLRTENAALRDKLSVAHADLLDAIRLVDYFVQHPAEWEAWKQKKA